MITKSTEVIFFDEAPTSTMNIEDSEILTKEGYTACDVKYQTARSFINPALSDADHNPTKTPV